MGEEKTPSTSNEARMAILCPFETFEVAYERS